MIPVDGTVMREIAPRFSGKMAERQAEIIKEAGQVLQATLEAYEINTRLRIAHFLGQTCHESAGFRTTEEFASGAAYEGRKDLGNVKKGDGRLYKGRGLLTAYRPRQLCRIRQGARGRSREQSGHGRGAWGRSREQSGHGR